MLLTMKTRSTCLSNGWQRRDNTNARKQAVGAGGANWLAPPTVIAAASETRGARATKNSCIASGYPPVASGSDGESPRVDIAFLARGLMIGLAIAAPVGAIGLLCIRRTLADGRLAGLVSGLGAATADAVYGAVAAAGLTAVSAAFVEHQGVVRLVGGAFLCYLGLRTALTQPPVERSGKSGGRLLAAYATTLALTLANPTTILSFVAIFAGLGLGGAAGDRGSAALMVLGVFLGSALWWLLLSGTVGLLRRAVTPNRLRWVNRVSGGMLFALGVVSIASLR